MVEEKPEGIWRSYYPSGKIKKEEIFKEGQLNGYAKEYDESGNIINSSLFRDGLMVDKKKTDSIDLEEVATKYPNGKLKTRAFYRDSIMIGIYREYDTLGNVTLAKVFDDKGRLLSKGIIKDDGSREGSWTYFYTDGSVKSAGEYKNNRQQGEWNFFFTQGGNEQMGNFVNGALTGKWTWFYANQKVEKIENFNRSKLEGDYYEFSEQGDTLVSGSYIEGTKNGIWKTKIGDITEIGNYVNDLKEGTWKSFYANNQLMYQGDYINGNAEGKHILYYENGFIKEEQFYVNGYKEKIWKKYDREGNKLLAISFSGDVEVRINGIKIDNIKRK
jgi:antitoxin component YwqK of YwqJK toxin-antitoxin module